LRGAVSMKRVLTVFFLLCMATAIGPAQACPQSSVLKFVVPFPPGGSYDMLARTIAQALGERSSQKVVVDNRSGGNGEVGTTFVAKAAPDGCTLVFWGDGILINQGTVETRAVDILKDFTAVSMVARTAQTLVARVGTPGHLVIELLNAKSGSKLRHVPYRGGALALSDLLGGHVELVSTGLPALIGQIQSGALITLAVSPEKRTPVLPDVPTMAEVAPAVSFDTWYGFLAPAGTPDPVRGKLHAEIAAIMRVPTIASKLVEQGFEIVDLGPPELRGLMERDLPRLMEVVALAGLKK
jgi:tripartite-type tricarboxylate transporter receptor subunit TctC